jgi:Rab11 family-interacting protein 3/4
VHHLEERFTVLAENQNDVDDRYTRAKQENAELSTKLFMLEEQLRDEQQRADEKLREEQRRHKDILTRIEREKQLQLENLEIRYQGLEKEMSLCRIENKRLEGTLERERNEKNHLNDKCSYNEREITSLREQNRELQNQNRTDRETMALESANSQQVRRIALIKYELEGEVGKLIFLWDDSNPIGFG